MVHDSDNQICTLLLDCFQVDDCSTCLSSQRFCYTKPATTTVATTTSSISGLLGDLTKLVAIGGESESIELYEVEVVDLLNPNSECDYLANYPVEVSDHTAAYLDGVIKSCGGIHYNQTHQHLSKKCYDYEPTVNEWTESGTILKPCLSITSSVMEDIWLISGGNLYCPDGGSCIDDHYYLNDTELWSGTGFELGSAMLPEAMSGHCQATINSTHLSFSDSGHAYILDYNDNIWTRVGDVPGPGWGFSCGQIQNSDNGAEILLAGEGYTYIFNLSTLEWREGPHLLPETNYYAATQLETTFVLAGGDASSGATVDTIISLTTRTTNG